MSEDDEEKTCFHTKERVYYFTHMPNGLKNSGATLQRTMEKVLAEHKEKNVEDGRGKVLMLCGNNKGNKSQSRKGKSHTLKHRCRRPGTGKEPMLAAHKHRTRNLLHSDGESSAVTDSHNKIPKKNLQAYKVNVVTDGPMGGKLKSLRTSGRLAPWAMDLKTYHISICTKGGSRRQNSEKVLRTRRASDAGLGGSTLEGSPIRKAPK
ncbi:hypothetical protein Tco_0290809 [Tanacetum coccineum]